MGWVAWSEKDAIDDLASFGKEGEKKIRYRWTPESWPGLIVSYKMRKVGADLSIVDPVTLCSNKVHMFIQLDRSLFTKSISRYGYYYYNGM